MRLFLTCSPRAPSLEKVSKTTLLVDCLELCELLECCSLTLKTKQFPKVSKMFISRYMI